MKPLERRLRKLEKAAGRMPCKNPEHGKLNVFFYGLSPEQDTENERRLESLHQCPRCSGDSAMRIILAQRPEWQRELPKQQQGQTFDLTYGEEKPPERVINFNFGKTDTEPKLKINFAEWQKPEDLN